MQDLIAGQSTTASFSAVVLWEIMVARIGEMLREARIQWGLSLRDVKDRSHALAQQWGSRSYEVSFSWLSKLESGEHEMTLPKLISLATIYSKPPEELFRRCLPEPARSQAPYHLVGPNTTVLVTGGPLEQQARHLLPDSFTSDPLPEDTMLLPLEDSMVSTPYRRAIIGRRDRTLDPMIRPGSILKIDTQKRAIASRKEWTNEFDRPIYLLQTHRGFVCGWCELDKEGLWLTLVTHSLSHEPCQRWRYRKEVEVIGRAVAVSMRLTA
jgi:transcriptional regulator with XRE-family HTH domain